MTAGAGGGTPAGWYPVDGGNRFWDGRDWTGQFIPTPVAYQQPQQVMAAQYPQQGRPQVVMQGPSRAVTYQPKTTSHTFHLLMSILTCGIWALFVWMPITVYNSLGHKKVVTKSR